jgi:hypothetical protein
MTSLDNEQNPAGSLSRFGTFIRKYLPREISLVADVAGVIGAPLLILGLFEHFNKDTYWGVSKYVWAWGIGFTPFVVLTLIAILTWFFGIAGENRSLWKLVADLRNELKNARERVEREAQQNACNAHANVFGYKIVKRRHQYRILSDGSAQCNDEYSFLCNRRSLGEWSRAVYADTIQEGSGSRNAKLIGGGGVPFTAKAKVLPNKGGRSILLEGFVFSPTISKEHGEVTLSYQESFPAGGFVNRHKDLNFDWVSAIAREPAETLEIEITFDGFDVGRLEAEAVYGPADRLLPRETVEANEALVEGITSGNRIARLRIAYPVLGVQYRIKWPVEASNSNAPSEPALALNPQPTPAN